jgi:hypothetical protein
MCLGALHGAEVVEGKLLALGTWRAAVPSDPPAHAPTQAYPINAVTTMMHGPLLISTSSS